jgi:hypothetical protein
MEKKRIKLLKYFRRGTSTYLHVGNTWLGSEHMKVRPRRITDDNIKTDVKDKG